MQFTNSLNQRIRRGSAVAVALLLAVSSTLVALADVPLNQISSDPYTNSTSQHKTEVEPDTFSFGSTIVAATQVGRFFDGGSSNIGWATSTDSGATWTHGFLPGITKIENPANPYDRVSDPAVTYDAKHNVWMVGSLAIQEFGGPHGVAVLASRSTDGGLTWSDPVAVATGGNLDKNWIVCDNTPSSPFYGNCYTQWDDVRTLDRIKMSTSSDGGLTWGPDKNTADYAGGLGGQPVVQPNGTVIVPIANPFETSILAFRSTDGGATWSRTFHVAFVLDHTVAGNLRSGPLPSAEVDGAGKVYVVWQDCRFRNRCSSNDILMKTSTDGILWSAAIRIPIDGTNSGVDHFIPGLAVDKSTSGSGAHLGLTYYYYPAANCRPATCQLSVGFISSSDGGASWNAPTQLAGPMALSWLPDTSEGRMVGDYISTSYAGGTAHPVFAAASTPADGLLNEALFSPGSGLLGRAGQALIRAGGEQSVPNAASDHLAPLAPLTRR